MRQVISAVILWVLMQPFGIWAEGAETAKRSEYLSDITQLLKTQQFSNIYSVVRQFPQKSCSYVVTSKSCYALTAAHCVTGSLDRAKLIDWQSAEGDPTRLFGRIDPAKVGGRLVPEMVRIEKSPSGKNEVEIDGRSVVFPDEEMAQTKKALKVETDIKGPLKLTVTAHEVKLVSIGDGVAAGSPPLDLYEPRTTGEQQENFRRLGPKEFNEYRKKNRFGELADYALVKLPETNCSCARIGSADPTGKLMMVGFPSDDRLKNQVLDANPDVAPYSSVSFGERCELTDDGYRRWYSQLTFLQKISSEGFTPGQNAVFQKNKRLYHEAFSGDLIFHNARSGGGASGGGLFNQQDEFVGLNIMAQNFDVSNDPFSAALSTKYIQDELRKKLPAEIYAEAFKCD